MFKYESFDHVQLAGPKGCEVQARLFYQEILGLKEIPKPEALRKKGGAWFQTGRIQIHIGIEEPFTPAKKAHPAIMVDDLTAMQEYLDEQLITYTVDRKILGVNRFYIHDPFGNRLEFLEHIGKIENNK